MSKTTIALEAAVAVVLENTPRDVPQTNRQRVYVDRAFAQILKLIAPRIRHFVRQYGLVAHFDDAEQVCAIAVHRAIEAYDPTKAQFTTFVNWQIRGELQSLRFRLMTDQRPSAKKVEATTVSLSTIATGPDGEEITPEALLVDDGALERTESAASDYLADGAISTLIDAYVDHLRKVGIEALARRPVPKRMQAAIRREGPRLRTATSGIDPADLERLEAKLEREREIVAGRVFHGATLEDLSLEAGITKERVRQITKRAAQTIADIAAADPRFSVMAEFDRPVAKRRSAASATAKLLPDADLPHNRLSALRLVRLPPTALHAEQAVAPAPSPTAPRIH